MMKMMSPSLRWGSITLICTTTLFSLPRSIILSAGQVKGLVNVVAPFSHQSGGYSPRRRHTLVYIYNSRADATKSTLFTSLNSVIVPHNSSLSQRDGDANDTQSIPLTTAVHPPQLSVKIESKSSQKRDKPAQRIGVWMPPSKNVDQRRGKIFSIQKPQDLLDFVIEDERLSVVKVYASWCKTCQVFDVRYRGLAAKFGDNHDITPDGERAQNGRVRFAEMQYDNPDNEEMCQLLNATKLPYIIMYKGSRGKVRGFQCSPAKFQLLIDAVNELADDPALTDPKVINDSGLVMDPEVINDSLSFSETIDGIAKSNVATSNEFNPEEETLGRRQLERETAEKLEMFEVMKAQIESDKQYIQKIESTIKTQQSLIDARDIELADLASVQKSMEDEMLALSNEMTQQLEESQQLKFNISAYQTQLQQLTRKILDLEKSITSLELESSFNRNLVKDREHQIQLITDTLEEERECYEKERNSLRKLSLLGLKRIMRGAKSILLRFRGKEIS